MEDNIDNARKWSIKNGIKILYLVEYMSAKMLGLKEVNCRTYKVYGR